MAEAKKTAPSKERSFVTGRARCAYLNVFTTRKNESSGEDEYSVELLIPKTDTRTIGKIKAAMKAAMEEKFSGKKAVVNMFLEGMETFFKTGKHGIDADENLYFPIRDGDKDRSENDEGEKVLTKTLRPEVAGMYMVRAKSQADKQPEVLDTDGEEITNANSFVSGDYARAALNCSGFEVKGNRGCSFWLNGLEFRSKGEPLGGSGKSAKKRFEEEEFEDEDDDEGY